jgi:hypothetical protein
MIFCTGEFYNIFLFCVILMIHRAPLKVVSPLASPSPKYFMNIPELPQQRSDSSEI